MLLDERYVEIIHVQSHAVKGAWTIKGEWTEKDLTPSHEGGRGVKIINNDSRN